MGKGEAMKTVPLDEWLAKLSSVRVRKGDMNKLVMSYLVTEGYAEAARSFQEESGTNPEVDLESIRERTAVRNAVHKGDVEEAIERVNDLNPEILDTHPLLLFRLQQQHLIELIREGREEAALDFAREELAPRGEENPAFLPELERTVALLAFSDAGASPLSDLLDHSHRLKTAAALNEAILASQEQEKESRLPRLLKTLQWVQSKLEEADVAFPKVSDVAHPSLSEPISGGHVQSSSTSGGSSSSQLG